MKLKKSKHLQTVNIGQSTVFADDNTGEWFRLDNTWASILEDFLSLRYEEQDFLNAFEDETDKEYFESLLKLMKGKNLLIPLDEKEKSHFRQVYFAVTNNCNLKCKHCCYDASSLIEKKPDLTTSAVEYVFDKIIELQPDSIVISGGEPLVRMDIIELLEYLRIHFKGKIILATNALLFNKNNIKIIYDLVDGFDISIDGVDEKTCSRIRGQGVFEKVINAINMLKEIGNKHISLSMVDIEKNKKNVDDFINLNEELGTEPVVRYFYALGRGADLQKELQQQNPDYNSQSHTEKIETKEEMQNYLIANRCGAGTRQILVDYDGRIYPCGMLIRDEFCMGNIFEIRNLEEYLQQYFSFEVLKPWNTEKCKKCKARLFCYNCLGEYDILQQNNAVEESLCCRKNNIVKIMEAL